MFPARYGNTTWQLKGIKALSKITEKIKELVGEVMT